MTTYYIDPKTGDDNLTGLSWAQAWRGFRGLRVNGVVPAAGDELRLARSDWYTPTTNGYYFLGQSGTFTAYRHGETLVNFGANNFRRMSMDNDRWRGTIYLGTSIGGTMVPSPPPADSNTYREQSGYSEVGGFNAPNTELWRSSASLTLADIEDKTSLRGMVRCHVPYTGPGDQDIPPNSVHISIRNGTSVYGQGAISVPIRNSSTEWTPFVITFPAMPASGAGTVVFSRTSVTIDRDNSPFGLEFSEMALYHANSIEEERTFIVLPPRVNAGGTARTTEEITANSDLLSVGEILFQRSKTNYSTSFIGDIATSRVSGYGAQLLVGTQLTDLPWTGASAHSPPGSLAAFDLNGSAGGTVVDPIRITGGWDPATDEVSGYTGFSAGCTFTWPSSFALLDLGWANHVKVERVFAGHGFRSMVTRAQTLHLKYCYMPFSLAPAFGVAGPDTNVTVESMFVAPVTLESTGTIGDLTFVNSCYVSYPTSKSIPLDCKNLTLSNSHYGGAIRYSNTASPVHIRGDAVLDQCVACYTAPLVSTQYGHTLVFRNHKPYPITGLAYLIRTAGVSRWDHIDYQDASMPTYNFNNPTGFGSTCDAKVTLPPSVVIIPEAKAFTSMYPTSLRRSQNTLMWLDGASVFAWNAAPNTSTRGDIGHQYTYLSMYPKEKALALGDDTIAYGTLHTPPWNYVFDQTAQGWVRTVSNNPPIATAGRVILARRFSNVVYRTTAETFLLVFSLAYTQDGISWSTVRSIYCPKAGNYRAHFGFMKDSLAFANPNFYGAIGEPMKLRQYSGSTGIQPDSHLGSLSVYSSRMVGSVADVPYYSPSAWEYAAAGNVPNKNHNEWHDVYIDFTLSGPGLVDLRVGPPSTLYSTLAIFDTLNIYERP